MNVALWLRWLFVRMHREKTKVVDAPLVSPAGPIALLDPPASSVVASGVLLGDKGVLALTWGDARTATCRRLGRGRYQLNWAHRNTMAFYARPWVDDANLVIECRHTRLRTFVDVRRSSGEAVDAHLYIALFNAANTSAP